MKWPLNWMLKQPNSEFDFEEEISFLEEDLKNITSLKALKSVAISGHVQILASKKIAYVDMTIDGNMILECAYSLSDVDYPFSIVAEETFSFEKINENNDDVIHEVKGDVLDIRPIVFQHILLEVPAKVVKPGANIVGEGKGWSFVDSDEDNNENKKVDPRFAKLSELFKDKK